MDSSAVAVVAKTSDARASGFGGAFFGSNETPKAFFASATTHMVHAFRTRWLQGM